MIILVLPDVTVDDERLWRAQRGDREAITAIYLDYFDPIYQFVRLRVGDAQIAEDLTSDIFVKFIQALKADKAPHTSLRGWIFRVARNRIYDHYGQGNRIKMKNRAIVALRGSKETLSYIRMTTLGIY